MEVLWYDVYRKLAELIYDFSKNEDNPGIKLYEILKLNKDFQNHNDWISKFENNPNTKSVDLIHIFSSFNGNKQQDNNRIKRINILFKILAKEKFTYYSSIDFYGCPAPFTIKMMSLRDIVSQNEIWDCFKNIMSKSQNGLLSKHFTQFKKWYGIDIMSFTQFLFWIDSKNFISLDRNTVFLLVEYGKTQNSPKTFRDYKPLITEKNTSIYRDLTRIAYDIYSKQIKPETFSQALGEYLGEYEIKTSTNDFKILGIRALKNISDDKKKVLKINELYKFYNNYIFSDDYSKIIEKKNSLNIYKIWDNIQINISAIVGKNGQGKSTITELIYMAIYSAALKQKLLSNVSYKYLDGLHLELYIKTNTIYRLTIFNDVIELEKFSLKDKEYFNPEHIDFSKFKLDDFFYTIAINYSQYGFNSTKFDYDWITPLSHKNDGYQTPIVINPMRTEGDFIINREDELLKSRLITNILELKDKNNSQNLRKITENREAKKLILSINQEKSKFINNRYINFSEVPKLNIKESIKKIEEYYNIIGLKKPYNKNILNYCVKKLIYICHRYKGYNKTNYFLNREKLELNTDNLKELLDKINNDTSHVTFKYKQAINYLRYEHLDDYISISNEKNYVDIEKLSQSIDQVKSLEAISKTIELIPPSIFNCRIMLEDNTDIDKISSGENQLINIVSSIVYHLMNIDSVSSEIDLINYKYVNIILDEVELYFHPDLQRKFINYLLFYLKNINLEKIQGINICFITHSPFILSDIINDNILFLGDRNKNIASEEDYDEKRTFGANIYDLLYDGFYFNDGFIGEFAEQKISDIIDLLNGDEIKEDRKWFKDVDEIKLLINEIGEPLLREKLLDMCHSKFPKSYNRELEIQKLKEKLIELENDTIKIGS